MLSRVRCLVRLNQMLAHFFFLGSWENSNHHTSVWTKTRGSRTSERDRLSPDEDYAYSVLLEKQTWIWISPTKQALSFRSWVPFFLESWGTNWAKGQIVIYVIFYQFINHRLNVLCGSFTFFSRHVSEKINEFYTNFSPTTDSFLLFTLLNYVQSKNKLNQLAKEPKLYIFSSLLKPGFKDFMNMDHLSRFCIFCSFEYIQCEMEPK